MKKALYITPNVTPRYRGYHVRIGNVVSLCFSCRFYGSDNKAFNAAKKYRDAVVPLLDLAKQFYKGNFVYPRNTTGHIGISLHRDGAYVAQWLDAEKKHHKKWFSINKYGEEKALALAIDAREKAVGYYPNEVLEQIKNLTDKVRQERERI